MAKEGEKVDNVFGISSTVLGIVSILLSITMVPSAVMAIIGIVFSIVQRKRSSNKWSTWGLILSIIGLVLSILIFIWLVTLIISAVGSAQQCMSNPSLPGCEQFIPLIQQNG